MKTEQSIENSNDSKIKEAITLDNKAGDALEALCVLGYTRKDVEKALSNIDTNKLTVEEIIKQGLKYLGR